MLASSLTISETAASQLHAYLERSGTPNAALRLLVAPGGCSGLQYGMALDESIAPDDAVSEHSGVRLVVDAQALPFVQGAEIDYVDGLMGAGFTVRNPNVTHSCSCGHSFATGDGEESPDSCCH